MLKFVDTTMSPANAISIIESAVAGDEVVLKPGVYSNFRLFLQNVGTVTNPVIIRSEDKNDPAIFDPGSVFVNALIGSNANAWMSMYLINIQNASYLTLMDLVVRNARVGTGNSCAVYIGPMGTAREPAEAGTQPTNITLKNVEMADSDDGLGSTGHNVLIEDCWLHGSGFSASSSARHNTYIHGGSITFCNTKLEKSGGHNIHTRAALTIIENCELGSFRSPCQIQVLTPKADMTKGQSFTQTLICRDSIISSERTHANPLRDVIEVVNGNTFAGLTQNVEFYGNQYSGPGGISRVAYLNRTAGTMSMGFKSANNSWDGVGAFFALASGQDINNSFYQIDVKDYQDHTTPTGTIVEPVVPPEPEPDPDPTIPEVLFKLRWEHEETSYLFGWHIWATIKEGEWGTPIFVEYQEDVIFSKVVSLPFAQEYFFRIRPLNRFFQEGSGLDTSIEMEQELPSSVTAFTVQMV